MIKVQSITEISNRPVIVEVECHISNSLPNILIVGFANKSVNEARERIRAALANSKIRIPRKKITINLAPADIPKSGSYLDLPILISIMAATGSIKLTPDGNTAVFGEVGLDGSIKPIRGMIGKILLAKRIGISSFWIPTGNLKQASLIPDIKLYTFSTVSQLYAQLNADCLPNPKALTLHDTDPSTKLDDETFVNIVGNQQAKRALLIAAAGNHNILLTGQPGAGKTALAKSLPSILPKPSLEEQLEITHVHSLVSRNFDKIHTKRPFRSPHHTSKLNAIIGGGRNLTPGEINLSHAGVLFLDEFMEFNRSVIESLRDPLESKLSSVTNSGQYSVMPADFLLIGATNPCPCGYLGSKKLCLCSPRQIHQYRKKLSGPILDRIDIYIEVEPTDNSLLLNSSEPKNIDKYRDIVEKARRAQLTRAGKLNNRLSHMELKDLSILSAESVQLLNNATKDLSISTRSYLKILRLARTIADIENSAEVSPNHVSEALQYRDKTHTS